MDTSSAGRRRHRSWPEALKREIVEASFAPGSLVSVVARRYDVNANQVFGWRKLYRDGVLTPADPSGSALIPVTVTAAQGGDASPGRVPRTRSRSSWPAGIVFVWAAASMARRCGACSTADTARVLYEDLYCA